MSLKHILFVNQDKTFRKVSGLRSLQDEFRSGGGEIFIALVLSRRDRASLRVGISTSIGFPVQFSNEMTI
jgi:hypothetical protein